MRLSFVNDWVEGEREMTLSGPKSYWLTFDCYGTLIQWDEGLIATIGAVLSKKGGNIEQKAFIATYDRYEHRLEAERPHRSFADISALALEKAMTKFGIPFEPTDAELLTSSIGRMPPFPEVVKTLETLKSAGFRLAIISNTDDAIIAGNVAQLGGHVDRVITAQQAGAYKPSRHIFHHAWESIGIDMDNLVHVCASPHLDLAAARDMGFRTIWVDRGTGRQPLSGYNPNAVVATLDRVPDIFATAGWMQF